MLADFVRDRRAELGLSLAQLAARANSTKGYMHQIEKGVAVSEVRPSNPRSGPLRASEAADARAHLSNEGRGTHVED